MMMGGKKLGSLSLFSGIGGLDLSLKGVLKPLVYCEIDAYALAVLHDQMRKGALPKAVVNTDVRTLTSSWIRSNVLKGGIPEAIVAGWPCPGHSGAGKRQSFAHKESGLFHEILRLVDEIKTIKYLFLENVANVLNNGMELLVKELHKKRNFTMIWVVVEAREVGAPHLRRRWFCVAHRQGHLPKAPAFAAYGYRPFAPRWAAEPPRTLCAKGALQSQVEARSARKRAFLLGNGVVPDCARYAFLHLLSEPSKIGQSRSLTQNFVDWPACGIIERGNVCEIASPVPRSWREPLPIVLDAKLYKAPKGHEAKNVLKPLRKKTVLNYWATPRAHLTSASQVMTQRTSHDLPTQIRNEISTPSNERKCTLNPFFLENMMGYPKNYTGAVETLIK
jgi:DNA (cytosine-5)-methyltransferase 1